MAKITFIGTASSIPTAERDNTSFIFSHKNETFLIDCPGSVSHKLLKIGLDYKKINKLIITHHHPDHIYGIVSLIHSQGYLNDRPITVYSNALCIKLIRQLLKLFDLNRQPYPQIKFVDVYKKLYFFNKNNLRLSALKNRHAKGSFGIKFSLNKKNIFYSSDTAFFPSMLNRVKGIDYLIHDCTASGAFFKKHPSLYTMHTNSADLAAYLELNKKTTLVPVHFLLLKKGELTRIKKELSYIKNKIIFPRDYQSIKL